MSTVNPNQASSAVLSTLSTLDRPTSGGATSAVQTREVSERPPAARLVSAEAVAQPSREAVAQAAKHIESFVKSVGRSLDFSVDSRTGQSVLRVMNPENGQLIRQLPAEETLRVAAAIDYMQSVLVNQRA
jgi:flagellar protein FlaG